MAPKAGAHDAVVIPIFVNLHVFVLVLLSGLFPAFRDKDLGL